MKSNELKPLNVFESATADNILMLQDIEVLIFNLDTYNFCILRPELLPFYLRGRLTNGESNPKRVIGSFDLIRSFLVNEF